MCVLLPVVRQQKKLYRQKGKIIMSGIAGIINFKKNLYSYKAYNALLVGEMANSLSHRGPDDSGEWIGEHAAFSHKRLSVIDPDGGTQPMKKVVEGYEFVITYNGVLYNASDLRAELKKNGYEFTTTSDTEVLLYTYIHYGTKCARMLNGAYAFCIWDSMRQQVFVCRDRFGIKPFFYSTVGNTFIFASEIKALFKYPDLKAQIDSDGLCEIFTASPVKTQNNTVFKNIYELKPAHTMIINRSGTFINCYWQLQYKEHNDSYDDTVEKTKEILYDSIKRNLVSDVPVATLLSSDLTSDFITEVAKTELQEHNQKLSTYSFNYVCDGTNLNSLTGADTNHTNLLCENEDSIKYLYDSMYYKDLPAMCDCDSSLVYYFRQVKKNHTVLLSGIHSDYVFETNACFNENNTENATDSLQYFDLIPYKNILKQSIANTLNLSEYSKRKHEEIIDQIPTFDCNSEYEQQKRNSYISINYFAANALERLDRMASASGLDIRFPVFDYRLTEYIFNTPGTIKGKDNTSHNILNQLSEIILPKDSLIYKKSPKQKINISYYQQEIKRILSDILNTPNEPINVFLDRQNTLKICWEHYNHSTAHIMEYLIQVNYFLKRFNPSII